MYFSVKFPAMVAQNITVDDYDPTVAGLMKTLLAERAASTPCHTQTALMVPSFSMTKQWQIPFDIENQASFETEGSFFPVYFFISVFSINESFQMLLVGSSR